MPKTASDNFQSISDVSWYFKQKCGLIDVETGQAFIAWCPLRNIGIGERQSRNPADKWELRGVIVCDPVPKDLRHDPKAAVGYVFRHNPAPWLGSAGVMGLMDYPGEAFALFAKNVVEHPDKFLCTEPRIFDLWSTNEPGYIGDYSLHEMQELYESEVEGDGNVYPDFEAWLRDMERSATFVCHEKAYSLVASEDYTKRIDAVKQGFGFDQLIKDPVWEVREAVALKGHGLDVLVNDEMEYVREAVARQGYGLEKLVNDDSPAVRAAVAEQGYGLEQLLSDENNSVAKTARAAAAKAGISIPDHVTGEWRRANEIQSSLVCSDGSEAIIEYDGGGRFFYRATDPTGDTIKQGECYAFDFARSACENAIGVVDYTTWPERDTPSSKTGKPDKSVLEPKSKAAATLTADAKVVSPAADIITFPHPSEFEVTQGANLEWRYNYGENYDPAIGYKIKITRYAETDDYSIFVMCGNGPSAESDIDLRSSFVDSYETAYKTLEGMGVKLAGVTSPGHPGNASKALALSEAVEDARNIKAPNPTLNQPADSQIVDFAMQNLSKGQVR